MYGDCNEYAADTRELVLKAIASLQVRASFMRMDRTAKALLEVYDVAMGERRLHKDSFVIPADDFTSTIR